ncbi:unnamed protein product, partial [Ascophyllum nodosum]
GEGPVKSCYGYPKDLLVACCEINHTSLTNYRLTRPINVNGTRPETHDRVDFTSSLQYYQLWTIRLASMLQCISTREGKQSN